MIQFDNVAPLDLRALKTFGVSSKDTKSPIGFFGTGLKYAIATLLRTGHKVTIHIDNMCHELTTEPQRIRNDDFDIVQLNGVPLAFTTELGKNWEVWMAFRELYSNMLDEGGACHRAHKAVPLTFGTSIVVSGEQIEEAYYKRDEIFLAPDKLPAPIFEDSLLAIYDRPSQLVYYRGVRVHKLQVPSRLTYNFLNYRQLTEDRTLSGTWDLAFVFGRIIAEHADVFPSALLGEILTGGQLQFEHGLQYATASKPHRSFVDCVREHRYDKSIAPEALEVLRQHGSLADILPKAEPMKPMWQSQIDASLRFLSDRFGIDVEFPIYVTRAMPAGMLGAAYRQCNQIVLSEQVLIQGGRMLTGTILEEYLHLKHELNDETRAMQNWLFDLLIATAERLP